jgi:putative transposase
MRYRRADVPGATYFFTVNLADRSNTLLVDYVAVLREAVRVVKQRHPFYIDAFVVLPDHLHALWTLPDDDADFATRWMLIKAGFSRHIPGGERRSPSRVGKGERGIWQRRYWEHLIRDEGDYRRHVDYIHYNPVKHGYVPCAADWPHSSIHRYIREGAIGRDWGGGMCAGDEAGYGER